MEPIIEKKTNKPIFIIILCSMLLSTWIFWGWYLFTNNKTLTDLKKSNAALQQLYKEMEISNADLNRENKEVIAAKNGVMTENKQLQWRLDRLKAEIDILKKDNTFLRIELDKRLAAEQKKLNTENLPPRKTIYLTFDDGPSYNTDQVLNILKREGIKATFFVNGNDSEYAKKMYRRIVDEGHAIGNHTYSHDYSLVYSSFEAYWEDTMKLDDLIYSTTGSRTKLIRFPGGSNNEKSYLYNDKKFMERLTEKMLQEGYQYFDWNISSLDASAIAIDKTSMVNGVLSRSKYKYAGIILFHDSSGKKTTVEALPEIIDGLKQQDFSFDILSEDSYTVHFNK